MLGTKYRPVSESAKPSDSDIVVYWGEDIMELGKLVSGEQASRESYKRVADWIDSKDALAFVDVGVWQSAMKAIETVLGRERDLEQQVADLEENLRKESAARASEILHSLSKLVWAAQLPPSTQLVVQAVVHFTEVESRCCTVGLDQLAACTGLPKEDVHEALRAAHDAGVLAYSSEQCIAFIFDFTQEPKKG